ncbi:MAG: SIS domain-containing protein [bacterium]|nr:SIS domain-containing protein [bacterium]
MVRSENEATIGAWSETLERGRRIYACGNGGSMNDAMHFAEELSGCFRRQRSVLPALAFSDPAMLSCIANDFGYD